MSGRTKESKKNCNDPKQTANEYLQKAFVVHLSNTTSQFINSLKNPILEKGETSKKDDLVEVIDALRAENNLLTLKLRREKSRKENSEEVVDALKAEKNLLKLKLQRETSKKDNLEEDIDALRAEKNVLTVKLHECNTELKEARQAFVDGLENLLPGLCELTIKQMGEIDDKPFLDAYASKYSDEPHKIVKYAVTTLSRWQKKISDPHWHPFSVSLVDGEPKEVLDTNDAKLKMLKRNHGNDVYWAVIEALREMNQYNSSGRYVMKELWNKTKNRKALLKEVINHVVTMIELPEESPNKRARPCKG